MEVVETVPPENVAVPVTEKLLDTVSIPPIPVLLYKVVLPWACNIPLVKIAVELTDEFDVELPTKWAVVLTKEFAPTLITEPTFAVPEMLALLPVNNPVILTVLEKVAAPKTANVPSVSIAPEVM